MRGAAKVRVGRFGSIAVVVVAAIVLLFPSSPTVLCVAPGVHIQIEDMGAPCCAHPSVTGPAARQLDDGINLPCNSCTDYFMTPNGRGATLASFDHAIANPLVGECPENRASAYTSILLCQSDALTNIAALPPVSSSAPLRC
jgi:hypothetical protein